MNTLGPYRIIRPLAIGGQAEILLGELEGPGGFVVRHALKVHKTALRGARPTEVPEARSLIAEARLLAQLSHPHTLAIHGLHLYEDRLVMVLEYVAGRSLATVLQRLSRSGEALPVEHALWLARCALMALDRAHSLNDTQGRPMGVVHRDVNPQNIIIGFDGRVKLIDFGIAISRLASRDTRFGIVKGKLAYMSPEQAYGLDDLDHRSDIYALGLVLYEMVTGVRPLEGNDSGALERARNPSIPQARRHKARLPATIDAILARALARKPERRFQTAREMMLACSELLHGFNPRFCGDEMGPFIQAVLRDEFQAEKRAVLKRGTMVVHTGDVSPPPEEEPEVDFDPATLKIPIHTPEPHPHDDGPPTAPFDPDSIEPGDDVFKESRRHHLGLRRIQEVRRIGDEPTLRGAATPPPSSFKAYDEHSAVRYQPDLAAGRKPQPEPKNVDDSHNLGDLLKAIEDIYKRRSGESETEIDDSTVIFHRE